MDGMLADAVVKPCNNEICILDDESKRKLKKRPLKVLDEDTYTSELEQIIIRDFFPELADLEMKRQCLDALEKNDLEKLRQLQVEYGRNTMPMGPRSMDDTETPSTFETPIVKGSVHTSGLESTHNPEAPEFISRATRLRMGLDRYLENNTSEDNASFSEIMQENWRKYKEKYAYLFEAERKAIEEMEPKLALPSIEQQAIEENPGKVQGWKYTLKSPVMYVPDGLPLSAQEALMPVRRRQVITENTRFHRDPFANALKKAEFAGPAGTQNASALQGRIGIDGNEVAVNASPQVNNYGFVATPSPAPGVNESPLMTWGEVEGTPLRLDGAGDATPGPAFKMPAVPKRDRVAKRLADEVAQRRRERRSNALSIVRSNIVSPSGNRSAGQRMSELSPAAKKLMSSKFGINTDSALRASYSPSPLSAARTPTPLVRITKNSPTHSGSTPKPSPSITDNLLQLPSQKDRSHSTDFF